MKPGPVREPGQEERLVAFLAGLSLRDVPDHLLAGARRALLDALGCGLFGARQTWTRAAVMAAARDRSAGPATVFAQPSPHAAPLAALCNGVAIHGYELDDLIAEAVVHPGAVVVPAALAAAERCSASGERLILGVIAGYETMARLGVALGLEPAARGYHTTALAGPVAAAVAAGVTMGFPPDRLLSAIGLACSSASGIKSFAGGSGGGMVKRLHAGRAAESGVRLCELADCGFEGPRAAITGRFGLLEVLAGSSAAPRALSTGLGQRWALQQVWVKLYPMCGLIQAAAQVVHRVTAAHAIEPGAVRRVRVGTSRHGLRHNAEPFPADTMAAQYSIPYCVAVALAGDAADPESYAPGRIENARLRALASRTELFVDEGVEAAYPERFGARVAIELQDGRVHEDVELDPHGTPQRPCSDEELTQKFKRLAAASVDDARCTTIIDLVSRVERLDTLKALSVALKPDPFSLTNAIHSTRGRQ